MTISSWPGVLFVIRDVTRGLHGRADEASL